MIPAQSSSTDVHAEEDGGRHRVQTCQLGWRLESALVAQVQECCRKEGLRPGQFMARALRCYLGQPTEAEHIYTAKELEGRIRFPANIDNGTMRSS
jgi:hypothetical protein